MIQAKEQKKRSNAIKKLKRTLQETENQIVSLEEELQEVDSMLLAAAQDYDAIKIHLKQKENLEAKLEKALEEWEQLSEDVDCLSEN